MGTWDDPESKVMVNGVPLDIHIEKEEAENKRKEDLAKRNEIYQDATIEISTIKKSYYYRPKFETSPITKDMHSSVKTFTLSEQIDYMLKQYGKDDLVGAFSALSDIKRKQIENLVLFYRSLKFRECFASDVVRTLKNKRFTGIRRKLLLLEQAGLLKRDDTTNGLIKYIRVRLASEAAVIATMIANADKMVGFISTPKIEISKLAQPKQEKAPNLVQKTFSDKSVYNSDVYQFFMKSKKDDPTLSLEDLASLYIKKIKED